MIVDNRRFSLVIAASLFVTTAAAFLRPPLLPAMGRDLGLGAIGLGALGSVFALGRLGADIPAGRLTDHIAPERMMLLAAVIVAVGSIGLGLAPDPTVAYVALFVLGVGSTWTLTTAQAWFANAPRARRGTAMSVFAGALLTGQAIGPALGGAAEVVSDWRVALIGGGVVAAIGAVPFVVMRSPTVDGSRRTQSSGGDDRATAPVLAVIYLLPAVQFAIGAAMVQTLVPIVADADLGLSAGVVGTALGVGGLARLVAAVVSGRIVDASGRRIVLVPGLALQLAGLGVFAFVDGVGALWVSIALVSFGSVSVNVGTTILADLSEGGRLGPRLGAFRFTGDAAFLVAPVLAGFLLETGGRTIAMLPLLVLTAAVFVGALALVPETHPA